VLFAHERRAVARAVMHVLEREGFSVHHVIDGQQATRALAESAWDALVVDVALPLVPGYELCETARRDDGRGARVVVLVSSVYRRTSYKRRPTRLYGADDYVEIHHLCDTLPAKLRQHLGLPASKPALVAQDEAREQLRVEGDRRMEPADAGRLAALIVADLILYNGDALHAATSFEAAQRALSADLAIARELYVQVQRGEGDANADGTPIDDALRTLVAALGRGEEATS
jgi:DNA-binding response OmpR family regulator